MEILIAFLTEYVKTIDIASVVNPSRSIVWGVWKCNLYIGNEARI